MECAKVLLAFGAKVDVGNAYKKTPLDLVEGPWRFFSRHDSNHAIGTFQSHAGALFHLESSIVSECVDMEYAPDKARNEFIRILKSLGAQRGRDLTRSYRGSCPSVSMSIYKVPSQHSPVEVHPSLAEGLSLFPAHCQHEQDLCAEKLMASIHSCEEDICHVLSSSDLEHGVSASDAMIVAKSMYKLKILRKAGSRILCLDGGGMRFLMQAEILAHIQAATGRKIVEMFDWIIGTSMGGALALMLVYCKWSFVR